MKQGAIFQTILAIIGLLVGYPLLGNVFILLMVPFVIYMIVKKDAAFLPALMIHCASDTSIMYAVFFGMIIMCIINTSSLCRNPKTRFIFIVLLALFPLYVILTIQKGVLDLYTWQGALGYTKFYLSFWAFLYCFLVADSFNRNTVKLMLVSFLMVWLLTRIPGLHHYYRVFSMIVFLGVVYGIYYIINAKKIVFGGVVCAISLLVFFLMNRTFTELLSVMYAIGILFLWNANKRRLAKKSVSLIPYIIIFFLMVYGINNYNVVSINYHTGIDFSDLEGMRESAQYKFFGDRAVFWDAAWTQLMGLKPILPIHDIPNITAYSISGNIMDDIEFGAHNTPLELLRIFGFIMGGALIICYIHCTVISARVFVLKTIDAFIISLFTVVFANTIIIFMGGTASMLPGYALFTFGLLGIAYGFVENSEKIPLSHNINTR